MKQFLYYLTPIFCISGIAAAEEVEINRALVEAFFKPMPEVMESKENPVTKEKVALGKMLYHDTRLSLTRNNSCNTCHTLSNYGVDNLPTSKGDAGKNGGRNSPTVFNAAIHIAQFWDGRSPTVEDQAKGPVLNPIEMGMPDADYVIKVLRSIPGYQDAFKAAFPDDPDPITYDNFGNAVGAFERKLVTRGKWDDYLGGDTNALNDAEKKGLQLFLSTGCATCHNGPAVGGMLYQKLGLVKPWPGNEDEGRSAVTGNEAEKYFFKSPSLRNIDKTGPYLHDGSIADLDKMVSMMAEYQLGQKLSESDVQSIVTFLKALTGDLPKDLIESPKLPEDGPDTPKPPVEKTQDS